MTVTYKVLIVPKFAEAVQAVQYTTSGVRASIDKFTATNTTTSNVTFSVNLIPSGSLASDSNLVVDTMTIPPGNTESFSKQIVGHVLENGDSISTLAGTASAITIRCSGREIS